MGDLDAQELSDLIGLVYDSALEPEQWRSLLERLVAMYPHHIATVQTRWTGEAIESYTYVGLDQTAHSEEDIRAAYNEPGAHGDPEHTRQLVAKGDLFVGAVNRSRELYSEADFRKFSIYKIGLEPFGLGHFSTLWYSASGSRSALLVFVEIEAQITTESREGLKQILRILSPHVVRAARIARALYMAKEAAESYKGFLDAIALPLAICDGGGVLQITNSAGQRLLDRGELLKVSDRGMLSLIDPIADDQFRKAMQDVAVEKDTRGLRIEQEDSFVSACIAPFHPTMLGSHMPERDVYDNEQLYAIFFGAHGDAALNAGLLQDVFSLTPREAQVCAGLAANQSPAQIARANGRAEKTVRNQIQAVYDKVGVTSTRELSEALSVFRTVGAMFDDQVQLLH